jgi:hypothetical protein
MIRTTKDGRTVRTGRDYTKFRIERHTAQHSQCAECGRITVLWHPLEWDDSFHVHHEGGRGMGGSKRDDTAAGNFWPVRAVSQNGAWAMRLHGKIDANQSAIVKELRQCGASVWITSNLGDGSGDIVVGWRGQNFIFEVKDPSQIPSKRKLTSDEKEFHANWHGQIHVIESAGDALEIMQSWKN